VMGSVAPEDDVFGQVVEIGGLLKHNGNLGVDLLSALALDVLLLDGLDVGQPILGQDLAELEGQRDALPHPLNLDRPMLFEHELGKEQPLVEPGSSANSVNIGLVEFGASLSHQQVCINVGINYRINSSILSSENDVHQHLGQGHPHPTPLQQLSQKLDPFEPALKLE